MFSVIIPVFNKANYLVKCIESVLAQTFSEFELLVIDDGSTDDSIFICQRFSDSRINLITQCNTGVATARNNGVAKARYKNIAFLDADDWWDSCFLEKMFYLINDFPEASIFGSQYYWVKNKKVTPSINYAQHGFRGYIDYYKAYTYAWWMPLSSISVVVRKETFQKLDGFKPYLKFGEDFDLWIRFALHYKVAYINEPLAYYNQDVDASKRAIGGHLLYPPKAHFIFNLAYLLPFEQQSMALKQLLDGLRVRSLLPYYLSGYYATEVKAILTMIDFENQPRFFQLVYSAPIQLVRLYMWGMQLGSRLKKIVRQLTQL